MDYSAQRGVFGTVAIAFTGPTPEGATEYSALPTRYGM